ncbi:Kelch repeat-containing protein [Labilibacter marinus]|uniref:Kelch repeat-containing protein n=1 Tax=Labilibacter marinus TaxID=1477105 RepID=UPI000833B788|nr:kelch repeat-containing protein [Labilibacter marinus]
MTKYSLIITLALFITSLSFTGCSSDDDEDYLGNWVRMADFDGIPRTEGVCFTIDNKAYIGTGYDIDNKERLTDFWVYDAEKDFWKQVASLPGLGRNGAIAFSSSTKGYVGTGYDGDNKLKDMYEYDPIDNAWMQKNDFPGTARYSATAFYVDGKGYMGTGYDNNYLKDFWSYDVDADSWTQITSMGGSKRRDAMNFVLNGEAYVLTGLNNGAYLDDMYKYDTAEDKWIELGRISDYEDDSYDDDYTIARYKGVTFVMDGKAYVATGINGANNQETWEYEPATDRWTRKTDFEGTARSGAVGFSLNNIGYVATGGNGSYSFDDVWKLNPSEEYENKD